MMNDREGLVACEIVGRRTPDEARPAGPGSQIGSSSSGRAALRPGRVGFTILMSAAMGMTALAIDTMLPAFDAIREDLGLDPESTDLTVLVSAFMLGFGLGQVPAGLFADRFGRRPVLWGGLFLYILGGLATIVAPTLWAMAGARFVWGLGAAGPRVAVTSMVRDAFQGEQMARQMSTIMAVFLVVPMFAPGVAAGLLVVGPWELTVWLCTAVALLVLAGSWGLPPTLPVEHRRSLAFSSILDSWRSVLTAPGTAAYLAGITVATGVFLSFLASSENIVDVVFGLEEWFPVVFGAMAFAMAIGAIFNGRVVERVGLERMISLSVMTYVALSALMLAVSLLADGTPEFWVFFPLMTAALVVAQVGIINANTAALVPLGHVAGSGAALMGMAPMAGGSLIGSVIDRQFDGTVTPLSVAFVVGSILMFLLVTHGSRSAPDRIRPAPEPLPSEVDCPSLGVG